MSILIKGMDMPKDGRMGVFISSDTNVYDSMDNIIGTIVPIPPHGDLIDAQEQMKLMQSCEYDTYDDYSRAFDMLDCAPTVIEAEE